MYYLIHTNNEVVKKYHKVTIWKFCIWQSKGVTTWYNSCDNISCSSSQLTLYTFHFSLFVPSSHDYCIASKISWSVAKNYE
jgi:hypothetical protein